MLLSWKKMQTSPDNRICSAGHSQISDPSAFLFQQLMPLPLPASTSTVNALNCTEFGFIK